MKTRTIAAEIKSAYKRIGTYTGVARKLSEQYGVNIYPNEIRRTIESGVPVPKLRRLDIKKRYRDCTEFGSEEARQLYQQAVEDLGGKERVINLVLLLSKLRRKHVSLDYFNRQDTKTALALLVVDFIENM